MISQRLLDAFACRLAAKLPLLGERGERWGRLLRELPEDQGEMLRFLCAAAPLSDLASLPFETLVDYARHGARLYETRLTCRALPEPVFLHYVIGHRVNDEEIEPCRGLFFEHLRDVVWGKNPTETVLAVNYWCAEQVTYRQTDDRTASALAVCCNGFGRCGEESVFAVNALRSVGIPARQIYAPYWSHCDNNHAWVEVWIDGSWHFLGACEPEEALDQGWFVPAASRAMLVHSRVFGPPSTGELVADRFGCVARANGLHRYADTKRLRIGVTLDDGSPAAGAVIDCEVLNYAGLVSIATLVTDQHGEAVMQTGKGTLHLHVRHGGQIADALAAPDDVLCNIVIGRKMTADSWQELTMWAPVETGDRTEPLSAWQRARGKEKRADAAARREKKRETFGEEETVQKLAATAVNPAEVAEWMRASCGNFSQLRAFWTDKATRELQVRKEQLLGTLSRKDLTDCRSAVLLEHLAHAERFAGGLPEDIFVPYLLCPRVENEPLTAYRREIESMLTTERKREFTRDPRALWKWLLAAIGQHDELEYPWLVTPPAACLQTGTGSERSLRILFVAACRALGVPARLRMLDGVPQFYLDGVFYAVEQEQSFAQLRLLSDRDDWVCGGNWTLARLVGGRYQTLRVPDGVGRLQLPAGEYRVITANRLPNGAVWGAKREFILQPGEKRELALWMREPPLKQILQAVPLSAILPEFTDGLSLWLWPCPGEEPTAHVLGELAELAGDFAALGENLVLMLAEGQPELALAALRRALPEARICRDKEGCGRALARRLYLDPDTLPLLVVTDPAGNGVYATCGYNVGSVPLAAKIIRLMSAVV